MAQEPREQPQVFRLGARFLRLDVDSDKNLAPIRFRQDEPWLLYTVKLLQCKTCKALTDDRFPAGKTEYGSGNTLRRNQREAAPADQHQGNKNHFYRYHRSAPARSVLSLSTSDSIFTLMKGTSDSTKAKLSCKS